MMLKHAKKRDNSSPAMCMLTVFQEAQNIVDSCGSVEGEENKAKVEGNWLDQVLNILQP